MNHPLPLAKATLALAVRVRLEGLDSCRGLDGGGDASGATKISAVDEIDGGRVGWPRKP